MECHEWLSELLNNGEASGSSGVDGMTVQQLPEFLKQRWPVIREQMLSGTYEPQPVKRVEIRPRRPHPFRSEPQHNSVYGRSAILPEFAHNPSASPSSILEVPQPPSSVPVLPPFSSP
jgi:hypothetical protein